MAKLKELRLARGKKKKKGQKQKPRTMLQPVRGMRDFLPSEALLRKRMFETIERTFEIYGFAPWEAPALEYAETLKKKSVEERLIYSFRDRGKRLLVLRPEKTPSLARIVSASKLPRPAKLYNIGRVWRYDRPQKGRYREFWQADIDIIGASSPIADAEVVAAANAALLALGLRDFRIRINSRQLINELLKDCGVSPYKQQVVMRAIDKLDKIGVEKVAAELREKGVSEQSVRDILALLKLRGNWNKIKSSIKVCEETAQSIETFLSYLRKFGIRNYIFDCSLVRGLDYYTGLIFEFDAGTAGSIAGGGRYDRLVGLYAKGDVPATGLALGIERIFSLLKRAEKNMPRAFVIPINISREKQIEIVQRFRKAGISTDTDLMGRGLSRNLNFASKQKIPYSILVGKEELRKKKFRLRNMKTGKEQMLAFQQAIKKLAS